MTAIAWDASDDGSIVYSTGPTAADPVIELKRHVHGAATTITSWDAPTLLPEVECDKIVLLQHFSDTATSCLVLAGGDVVVVREDPEPGQEKIEIAGSVDAGIAAAAWAPDGELLAIVSRADTLILMSRDFESITDVTLKAEDLKTSKHVSVGWGKKETQFQGKRAKALRDPTMPESVDEGKLSPFDSGTTTVSWRGDGALVAINNIVSGRRAIRVFTRDAVLDSALLERVRPEGCEVQLLVADDRRHASPAVGARNGHAVDVGLLDSRKRADRLRHLGSADVLALPTEAVANPIDEIEIPVLVLSHQVTRSEPRISGLEHMAQDLVL